MTGFWSTRAVAMAFTRRATTTDDIRTKGTVPYDF